MTKRHRKQNMLITGNVHGINYAIEQSVADDMKTIHGLDAVTEVESMIRKELELNPMLLKKDTDED